MAASPNISPKKCSTRINNNLKLNQNLHLLFKANIFILNILIKKTINLKIVFKIF